MSCELDWYFYRTEKKRTEPIESVALYLHVSERDISECINSCAS
jgi:hypothetical protein